MWCGWKSRITRPEEMCGSEVAAAEARPEAAPASTTTATAANPIVARVGMFTRCPWVRWCHGPRFEWQVVVALRAVHAVGFAEPGLATPTLERYVSKHVFRQVQTTDGRQGDARARASDPHRAARADRPRGRAHGDPRRGAARYDSGQLLLPSAPARGTRLRAGGLARPRPHPRLEDRISRAQLGWRGGRRRDDGCSRRPDIRCPRARRRPPARVAGRPRAVGGSGLAPCRVRGRGADVSHP